MPDRFSDHAPSLLGPASHGFAVTPNDAVDLPEATRALHVGSAGALSVTLVSGATVTLSGVVAGTVLPLRVRRVLATGTTAGAIVGLV